MHSVSFVFVSLFLSGAANRPFPETQPHKVHVSSGTKHSSLTHKTTLSLPTLKRQMTMINKRATQKTSHWTPLYRMATTLTLLDSPPWIGTMQIAGLTHSE